MNRGLSRLGALAAFLLAWGLTTDVAAQLVPLTNIVRVEAGSGHACALTSSGGVKCWGQNTNGQLGDGTTLSRLTPVDVVGLGSGVQAITAGDLHSCALLTAGSVKCWGINLNGRLGDGSTTRSLVPTDVVGLSGGVQAIDAGSSHSCAILIGGALQCWGDNTNGQLGDNTTTQRLIPTAVVSLASGVQFIAAGGFHTCAIVNGGAKCWGWNSNGQVGDGSNTQRLTPVDAFGLNSGVVAIAAGGSHSCALNSTGGLKCWGNGNSGQLGVGAPINVQSTPADVTGLTVGVQSVATGVQHSCALTNAGAMKCWGDNQLGQVGDGGNAPRLAPVDVVGLGAGVVSIGAGGSSTCAVLDSSQVNCWGNNFDGQQGDGKRSVQPNAQNVDGLAVSSQISSAYDHTCAVSGGGVTCWGRNAVGQLGDGSTQQRGAPVAVSGMASGMAAISAGGDHSCALTDGGGIKCWGGNFNGELGDGTVLSPRYTPVDVTGLTSGVQAISAGTAHTCALTAGGGVKCWGGNPTGQVGDGTTTQRLTAVDVIGLTSGVAAISAGAFHTCALTNLGGVKCWGGNNNGRVGDGSTTDRLTPVDVTGLTSGVVAITAGGNHTCALTSIGGIKCWGGNFAGQLGDGTFTQRLTAVDVNGLGSGVQLIDAGFAHTCAVSSAVVRCWGSNGFGQLGDGRTTSRNVPVLVSGSGSSSTGVSAGSNQTCAAVDVAGAVKCWGRTQYGAIGDDGRNYALPGTVLINDAERAVVALTPAANNASLAPTSDASGRYVVFQSEATNLGPPDSNGASDIYRVDTETGDVVSLSVNDDGSPIGSTSMEPSVSADGEVVLFVAADSGITKLFGEPAKRTQTRAKASGFSVLMRNRITGTTQRMGAAQPGGTGTQPQLAPSGAGLVYSAPNVDPMLGAVGQIEVFQVPMTRMGNMLVPGTPRCVSCKTVGSNGQDTAENSDGDSRAPTVSADGKWVAWETVAKNLLVGTPPPCPTASTTIMLRNLATGVTQRISTPPTSANCGAAGTGSKKPKVDWKGNRIVFESDQPLKPGDANGAADVYLFDLAQNRMTRVSETAAGVDATGASTEPTISGDGEMIAFVSAATNLDVTPDTNARADAHVRSLRGGIGAAQRLSKTSIGNEADSDSRRPALNYNGTQLAFDSDAGNLAPGAQAGVQNVFQRANPLNSLTIFSADFE